MNAEQLEELDRLKRYGINQMVKSHSISHEAAEVLIALITTEQNRRAVPKKCRYEDDNEICTHQAISDADVKQPCVQGPCNYADYQSRAVPSADSCYRYEFTKDKPITCCLDCPCYVPADGVYDDGLFFDGQLCGIDMTEIENVTEIPDKCKLNRQAVPESLHKENSYE